MNKKNFLVFMGLACAGPSAWGVDPLDESPPPQRNKIPKGYFRLNANRSLEEKCIYGDKFSGDHKDPLSDTVPENMIGKSKALGACVNLSEKERFPSKVRRKLYHIFKGCKGRRIEGNVGLFSRYVPGGRRAECATVFLQSGKALALDEHNLTRLGKEGALASALRDAKEENHKGLRKIKDLAVEHLLILLDSAHDKLVQGALEGAMKNPYCTMKTLTIISPGNFEDDMQGNLLLPIPIGKKAYPQKKLQEVTIVGKINPETVKTLEKHTQVKKLCLEGGLSPFEEGALETLVQSRFPSLKSLMIKSRLPFLEEIKKAPWAKNIKKLYLASPEQGGQNNNLLRGLFPELRKVFPALEKSFFPALENLKLSGLGSADHLMMDSLLENVPDLTSFHARDCYISLSSFSTFLQGLSEKITSFKLENTLAMLPIKKVADFNNFYQWPAHLAGGLRVLTLKNCGAKGARLEHFFGASPSFGCYALDLSNNSIEIRELSTVFSKEFPYLKELDVSGNIVGGNVLQLLIENRQNFPELKSLTLPKCFFMNLIFRGPQGQLFVTREADDDYSKAFRKAFPNTQLFFKADPDDGERLLRHFRDSRVREREKMSRARKERP